jgi:hypothetical protein
MRILVDKTIEEMAAEGYRPVLNPGIFRKSEITKENVGSLNEDYGILLSETIKNAYPGNPIADQIETIVIRVNLTRTTQEGEIFKEAPYFQEGQRKIFCYPMLAYVKD